MEGYNEKELDFNGIRGRRIAERLASLSKIGLTSEGGSFRLGYSKEEREAKELVKGWMRQAGLAVREDGAGNVFGRLAGNYNHLPIILSGSHLDSVPNGGHFDGTLGVVAALEIVESWNEEKYRPNKPFEVVVFSDEEGARFNEGYVGSKAMMGKANIDQLKSKRDADGVSFEDALIKDGLSLQGFQDARRNPKEIDFYVEVHIEQGKILERNNLPCGIVNGIAGPSWHKITFYGKAGHAGSTPMDDRSDALVAAGKFIHELQQLPKQVSSSSVATVGKISVQPNGINVIPGEVTLFADIRDVFEDKRESLIEKMQNLAKRMQREFSIEIAMEEIMNIPPVLINQDIQSLLHDCIEFFGYNVLKMPSGAGHDAMIIGEAVPAAMLFVQSKDGISHSPLEWTSLSDCVKSVHVLKRFIEKSNEL